MVLVDTSSWIHLLRPDGSPLIRARVAALLEDGTACWCPPVRLELWNNAAGTRDHAALRDFERVLVELPIDGDVWDQAYDLSRRARRKGLSVPAPDILIHACAVRHRAGLETVDGDLAALATV